MRILIGAPAKRPLSPNEKRVYDLLKQGFDPKEIARKLHMPYGTEFMCNVHDVTCDTVRHLITSIREKGYTINEEDKPMQKYTDEQKKDVLKFHLDGLTQSEIAERCGVNVKTVSKWICDYKKENEPAQAATCTDSGCA